MNKHPVGRLSKIVTFQIDTPTPLGAGYEDSWGTLLTTRGYLLKNRGGRVLENGEIYEDNSYDLWVRYQPTLETNLSILKLRLQIDQKTYVIHSIEKEDQRNFYYRFLISEHKF